MYGTAASHDSHEFRDGQGPRPGGAIGCAYLERQPPLLEKDTVCLPNADGGIVDVRCLRRDTVQLEHRESARLEVADRRRAKVEPAEVEARMTLRDGFDGP